MLTKMLTALVMTGALWVAGDAAYAKLGCCFPGSDCCDPPSECCVLAAKHKASDCCAPGSDCCNPLRECCVLAKGKVSAKAACYYCTITDEGYDGCCCEIVNGQYRCLLTGVVSDECCCIPLE